MTTKDKVKMILLKTLNVTAIIVLILSAALSALGFISLLPAEFTNWVHDILPFLSTIDPSQVIMGAGALGTMAASGGFVRITATQVRKATNTEKLMHEIRLKQLEEKHALEMDLLRKDYVTLANTIVTEVVILQEGVAELTETSNKLHEFNQITAQRNANSKLVPEPTRNAYKEYLKDSSIIIAQNETKASEIKPDTLEAKLEETKELNEPKVEVVDKEIEVTVDKEAKDESLFSLD